MAHQWSYYAHWEEIKYNLVLNGNGGTVPEGITLPANAVVSEDRKKITFSDLSYTEYCDLSSQMFFKDENSVLASWNTRQNGTGESYYSNDSVNKLTELEGSTITLLALWHTPDAVVTLKPQNGSEDERRFYDINEPYGTLGEPVRNEYTFLGWFDAEEDGKEIKPTDLVIEDKTIWAHWGKNPTVTFNAADGFFDEAQTQKTVINVYAYGDGLTNIPVPANGSATFVEWYIKKMVDGVEEKISVDLKTAKASDYDGETLYAKWGYRPKFETNGGVFTSYDDDNYPPQDDPLYTITTLPGAEKEFSDPVVWKADVDNDGNFETIVTNGSEVNLSHSNVIKAFWTYPNVKTVTFNYLDGTTENKTIDVYKGHKIIDMPKPTREGYTFKGWFCRNDQNEFVGNEYTADTTIDESVTLYAKWEQNEYCTLTFDPGEGEMVNGTPEAGTKRTTFEVLNGKPIATIPAANLLEKGSPLKYLEGWYTGENGTGSKLDPNEAVTENQTYYANWKTYTQTTEDNSYKYLVQWSMVSVPRAQTSVMI